MYVTNIRSLPRIGLSIFSLGLVTMSLGCGGSSSEGKKISPTAESCMSCHNGSDHNDYGGDGLENPHPFSGGGTLLCTTCHGGDPEATSPEGAHVPPPPEIGDDEQLIENRESYFNRLTLTGIDKYPDYIVDGVSYSALDYLQFVNPGDLRIVTQGRSCGQCHQAHADCVGKSLLATEAGVLSGAMYAIGSENQVDANKDDYEDTAADLAFRAVQDEDFTFDETNVGAVSELVEFPVFSSRNGTTLTDIFNNQDYNAFDLADDIGEDGRVISGSPLANLYHEQVAFTCGDCHLGSAGANNRYGDFRSSGCSACHMPYSLDGRSRSTDPNINKEEPLDPDDIEAPERPHVKRHRIVSIAQTLPTGEQVMGMDDYTCAGCHQGSNRTVMQYWGIRLDQNQDVRRQHQYPANPFTFQTTREDERLFDPEVENRTFNGRNANQYLLFEDYDGDGRDDTPPDVHYEAGLGCIDCHGSHDLHGGRVGDPDSNSIHSRMEQAVAITCESCHGTVESYAETVEGTTYSGETADLAVDREGNPLKHVRREADGHFYLYSRLTGKRHYVSQVRDVTVDNGRVHPFTDEPLYSVKASYAMGTADGDPSTGLGPVQSGPVTPNFTHMANMSCASCHSSWTNNCIGCHLEGEYDQGANFSNITGERIVFEEENADFVYQSPVFFQLGVDTHNKIAPIIGNTDMFFQYKDLNNDRSKVFAFSDRNAQGNNASETLVPSLSHNVMMPHSIRGKVNDQNEGARYCVACHLTDEGLQNFGADYASFRAQMAGNDYGALNFQLLREHIGQNTGNQLNSPLWVHNVAGLGSGLFLFDEDGCAVNPLDENDDRVGCDGQAPANNFDANRAYFNLDKIVDIMGISSGSNNHPMLVPNPQPNLRDGSAFPNLSGPLGATLILKLTDPDLGIVLDSWLDADGRTGGDARLFIEEN